MEVALGYLHHLLVMLLSLAVLVLARDGQFVYNGFRGSNNLHLDGLASIHTNGLLQMTNYSLHQTSHAFYPNPMIFKPNPSFSTTFVFAMVPQLFNHSSHGIVFIISPTMNFQRSLSSKYLGLFNASTNGLPSNHIFAVELEPLANVEFGKKYSNHVGIDINGLSSVDIAIASYFSDKEGMNKSLMLGSGKPMQVWIDYDGTEMLINVTLAPVNQPKPSKCLLSKKFNLSSILVDSMYVGFSSSTGQLSNNNYILGWSWNQSGQAQGLDPSKLPSLPRIRKHKKSSNLIFHLLLIVVVLLFSMIGVAALVIWRNRYKELLEPWEEEYSPHRFAYKDLFIATKGFQNSELLGVGGFGKVYKGRLPTSHAQVAVKQVSHNSRQGMKEFVAEIASMRRLRHRNLVQLLGYCRRKGELLLVYEYMPNGSLDKFLFCNSDKPNLCWSQRYKIIKGVASALLYLHEGWEQIVLHRDVKASNVLLDAEMNACLGDFGLARLHDHGTDPRTTQVVGTMGYIAPETSRTRKPTTSTDVFSFGIFLLEVACGRRPIDQQDGAGAAEFVLLDWVYECWKSGNILAASDTRLEGSFDTKEMEVVLELGLLCAHSKAEARPSMRRVVLVLDGVDTLPEISPDYDPQGNDSFLQGWGASASFLHSFPSSSSENVSHGFSSSINSILHYGR